MITEAVDSVTDQFNQVNGITEHMQLVLHLSSVLNEKLEKILLSQQRRAQKSDPYEAILLSSREIEFLLWASNTAATAAETLSAQLDSAHNRLVEAFNHDTRAAA